MGCRRETLEPPAVLGVVEGPGSPVLLANQPRRWCPCFRESLCLLGERKFWAE